MSTVAPRPPASPVNPALLDSERYIDEHIHRTRRALKLVDLAAGVITLALGLLAFLLVAALIDHWVVPGGLGPGARMTLSGAMVAGIAWYGWRQFAPLVRSINPVYAAHAIEKSAPSLKNSLLNLLLFRGHRQGMSARVYHALEQQAAQRLSTASTDGAIDRAALLRLGYALLAIIAACGLYGVLSPKNLATSAARILAPLADIAAPSRVQILNIEPGDSSVARGERVAISAEILGAAADEPVRLRYSTADEQVVDETVVMTQAAAGAGGRFSAELPRASDAGRAAGVLQDVEYWIEAGDAVTRRFRLSVFHRPTIVVQRLRYEYPAYTGEPSKTVDNVGDIRALEGTRVTVEALASQPIKKAHVDFDGDGTSDLTMRVDGDRAYVTFDLGLRPDRRTPLHETYVLRFTTTGGRTNSDPAQYRIEVTPDYAPEVRITAPEEPELEVRRDQLVLMGVEARDPDYAVQRVRLVGRVGERDVEIGELLSLAHTGRFSGTKPFVPGDAQLQAGDVLEYWAEAIDNRRPDANVTLSERRRLRIIGDDAAENPQREPGGGGGAEQGEGEEGGADGEPGAGEQQQPAEGGGEGESGGEEGEPGAGAPGGGEGGAQSEEGEPGEGEPAAAGGEGGEESGGEGAEGGQAGADGDQSGEAATEQSGSGGEQQAPAGEESTEGEPGDAGGSGGGEPSERVSTEGDDDPTAFDRIRERFAEQDAESGNQGEGAEGAEGAESGGEQSAAEQQGAEGEASGGEAADSSGGAPRDPAGAEAPSGGEAGEGETSEGEAPAEGESGEQPAGEPGEAGAAGESAGDQQGESETPAGADGANNPNNGGAAAGDDEGGEPGAPEASSKNPGDDSDAADEGESGAEGDAATADSQGDTESDTPGDTGGDRSGAGQRGGGQQADNPGEGEAGSHEAAETGAGEAVEQGAGETGEGAGEEQLAEGETGESSGDQPGEGSQSREADGAGEESGGESAGEPTGEQPGGDPAAGEQPDGAGEESGGAEQQGAASEGESAGAGGESEAAGEQPSGSPAAEGQQPGGATGDPADPGDESPQGEDTTSGASSTPPTGGGNGQGGVDGTSPGGEPGGDDANLRYAREQTDLVLERLDEQLANQDVDKELLERLGWTEDELEQFVARWHELQARAASDDSGEAQQELDGALRSLGLRPTGPLEIQPGVATDDMRDLNDAARKRPPIEYMDRVRWYMKGASAGEAE